MTASQHTPGPYTEDTGRFCDMLLNPDWTSICCGEYGGDDMAVVAYCHPINAALFAAAPDLLAACEAALAYLNDYRPTDIRKNFAQMNRHENDAVKPLYAAIARAKGEA